VAIGKSAIDERLRRIEEATGKPVVLRAVRPRQCCFRGRVEERGGCFLVEYCDDNPGCSWDHDIVRELLECIERRRGQKITLYDGDVQYVEVPLQRAHRGRRPPPGE